MKSKGLVINHGRRLLNSKGACKVLTSRKGGGVAQKVWG